jgi:hypothetical protein
MLHTGLEGLSSKLQVVRSELAFIAMWLRSYAKVRIPYIPSEQYAWTSSIIALSGMPDNDSMRQAVATIILHHNNDSDCVSMRSVVAKLRKQAANQTAFQIIEQIREANKAAKATTDAPTQDPN